MGTALCLLHLIKTNTPYEYEYTKYGHVTFWCMSDPTGHYKMLIKFDFQT